MGSYVYVHIIYIYIILYIYTYNVYIYLYIYIYKYIIDIITSSFMDGLYKAMLGKLGDDNQLLGSLRFARKSMFSPKIVGCFRGSFPKKTF